MGQQFWEVLPFSDGIGLRGLPRLLLPPLSTFWGRENKVSFDMDPGPLEGLPSFVMEMAC